jgi:peptidoglycan hydrolase CwlO-like protein
MNTVKRSAGLAVILFSALFLLLCVAGIAGVWILKGRVNAVGKTVLGTADDSLALVDEKLAKVQSVLKSSTQRIGVFSRTIQRLQEGKPETKAEVTSLLKALDEEVFDKLRTAGTWLDSSQVVAVGISRVSEAVVSSKFAASHQDAVGVALAERVQDFSESVADVLAKLEDVRSDLVELRDSIGVARAIVTRTVARFLQVDEKLANLCKRIDKFRAGLAETKESVADLEGNFGWWTALGAVALTAILLWFGVSQAGMMLHGWRWQSSGRNEPQTMHKAGG